MVDTLNIVTYDDADVEYDQLDYLYDWTYQTYWTPRTKPSLNLTREDANVQWQYLQVAWEDTAPLENRWLKRSQDNTL